jgi:hypothetical protein
METEASFDADRDEEIPLNEADLDRTANWTIKNVPLRFRLAVRKGASAKGESTYARIARAHDLLDAQEAGQTLLRPRPNGRLVTIGADSVNNSGLPTAYTPPDRLTQIETLARIAQALTPEGKDSRALQMARRAVCLELTTLIRQPEP